MIDVTLIRMMGAHAVTMSRAILHLFSRHWNFKCLTSARAEGLGNCAFLQGQQSLDGDQFLFKSQFPKLMRKCDLHVPKKSKCWVALVSGNRHHKIVQNV